MVGSCRRESKMERFARRRPLPATKSRAKCLFDSTGITMEESTLDALDAGAAPKLNAKA